MKDLFEADIRKLKEENAALIAVNKELLLSNKRKDAELADLVACRQQEQRIEDLLYANEQLVKQNAENRELAVSLASANKDLALEIAKRAQSAKDLIESNKELAYHIQEKENRAAELELANQELESFSYSVSHDLRAPLRAINGFTEVLLEDYGREMPDDAKELLSEIIANSKKMGELIDNLLEFSRLGKHQVAFVRINTKHVVNTAIAELKILEPGRPITFIVNNLEPIYGDRQMIRQVFFNLLSNAVKYSGKKADPIIEIGNYREGDLQTYYVKDNGAGFDMRYADKLFGIFQRLHSSSEFEGTGVGLAIIQKIVAKHGGTVRAEGKVAEGATFSVSFPII